MQRGRADAERRHGADAGHDSRRFIVHRFHSLVSPASSLRATDDQVDRVADGLELLHVLALEHDAVVVLDDLGQLDEVERVDVELLERRVRA